jgi:phage host-nuclease inhibitor protein Gam
MLNALLQNELLEVEEVQNEEFKVESIDQANWCFRKIRALQEKVTDNKRLAADERTRIDMWEKKETEAAENSISYFESVLTEYFIKLRQADPKAKVSTPYGKISSRKQQPKWDYSNENKIVNFLKENELKDLVRTKEEAKKDEVKKTVEVQKNIVANKDTGEVLNNIGVKNVVSEDGSNSHREIIDLETGELLNDVDYFEIAAVYNGKVIPGINISEQLDKITIKVE